MSESTERNVAQAADSLRGLDQETVSRRLLEEGPNDIGLSQQRSLQAIMIEVGTEPMFLLLIAAGLVYLLMGDAGEALVLLGFVLAIMGITIAQERRTDNALGALRDLSSPRARVIRSGVPIRIAGSDVVRDDVLVVAEGDRIAADGNLLEAHELAIDESMLSGESLPVTKAAGDTVYAGTLVVSGQGIAQVRATGPRTEMGRIGTSLDELDPETSPLRRQMDRLTRRFAAIGLLLSLALAATFWVLRNDPAQALLAGIALAMSLLPQEFPVIMIIFFAFAARRLGKLQVLTRRLGAIETLGQTSVLCVDKTGTLTQNRMQVAALRTLSTEHSARSNHMPDDVQQLVSTAVLACEMVPHDPMEKAILDFSAAAGLAEKTRTGKHLQLAREYELSPELLAMSHVWRSTDGAPDIVATKGAPEAVALLCRLPDAERERVTADAEALAARGLRVLGVARASHPGDAQWPATQREFRFTWLGLVALADPLRPEVPAAVALCRRAGIRVVMITGDHASTAAAIAHEAGIDHGEVLTGAQLAAMSEVELRRAAASVHVFARVKPWQKLALVEALKAQGAVVAMTGDGVNDAPALKAAHIGIAMGQRGTDVAREAASLVLLRDDFTSIVDAIRMGRRTFRNMRQAMVYTLAVHLPIAGLALLPVLFGLPLLLAPLHIAFLELVIDPACSVVFEAEDIGDEQLMQVAPRPAEEPLLETKHALLAISCGLLTTVFVFAAYASLQQQTMAPAAAGTTAFILLVCVNALLILPLRSPGADWRGLFRRLPATSLWVLGATLAGLVMVTSVPSVARAFGFETLHIGQWLLTATAALATLPAFQALRLLLAPATAASHVTQMR
jgi:Ca2+-transporting ATPase